MDLLYRTRLLDWNAFYIKIEMSLGTAAVIEGKFIGVVTASKMLAFNFGRGDVIYFK